MGILLLGYSTRAAAECILLAGFRDKPDAIDCFADADTRMFTGTVLRAASAESFREAMEALAGNEVTVCYTSLLFGHGEFLEICEKRMSVSGNTVKTLRELGQTGILFDFLRKRGVCVPEVVSSGLDCPGDRPFLIKKTPSEGGRGVRRAVQGQKVPTGAYGVAWVEGNPCSAAFLADGKRWCLVGTSEQLIGENCFGGSGFNYGGNLIRGDGRTDGRMENQLTPLIDGLVTRYQLRGLNGIDLIRDAEGRLWFLEINPRFTAAMELYAKNGWPELMADHVQACRGTLPARPLKAGKDHAYHGKAILYSRKTLRIKDTAGWFALGVRDIPCEGTMIGKEEPVCTVFADGRNRQECIENLIEMRDRLGL